MTSDVLSAFERVWHIPPPGPANLLSDRRFLTLSEALASYTGRGKAIVALYNALRSLGLPSLMPPGPASGGTDLIGIAERLLAGFMAKTTRRRHLCPLELADHLPAISFGPARIAAYSAIELEGLFDRTRLDRHFPGRAVDYDRLAQLQWLSVEETVEIDPQPEARAVPILFTRMDRDFGAFDPHERRYPAVVERALFCLLLAPWEDWSTMPEVDWRGFKLPWIYTVDEDIAVRPAPPPDAEALAFEPVIYTDYRGEEVEDERPVRLHLEDEAGASLSDDIERTWQKVDAAQTSDLFATPVEHFTVRAYAAAGIDELIAQMTVLEAALGDEGDHNRSLRPKSARDLSATERMARKTAGLLNDKGAASVYKTLFAVRSRFIHGRAGLGSISTDQRVIARRLARQVASKLLEAASGAPARADFLDQLLTQGAP